MSVSRITAPIVLILVAAVSAAQDAPLKARASANRRIILDVVARPSAPGTPGFTLTDNGKLLPASDLELLSPDSPGNADPQLLLVIDALNSTFQDVTRSEEAVTAFLKASPTLPQRTSIVILSDTPAQHTENRAPGDTTSLDQHHLFAHRIPASRDSASLIHALTAYQVGFHRILEAQAGAGQAERVQLSLQALSFIANAEAAEPGPKIVLWISPGWPLLATSSAKSSQQLFDSIVYFSDLLRSSRIILYSISPEGMTTHDQAAKTEAFALSSLNNSFRGDSHANSNPVELSDTYYKSFLAGVRSPNDSNPNDLALQVLAFQTGGLVLQQNNDLKAQISQCAADAQQITSVAFTPKTSPGELSYHALQLKRTGDSARLRTRTGLYTR